MRTDAVQRTFEDHLDARAVRCMTMDSTPWALEELARRLRTDQEDVKKCIIRLMDVEIVITTMDGDGTHRYTLLEPAREAVNVLLWTDERYDEWEDEA